MASVDKVYGFRLYDTAGKQPYCRKYTKTTGAAIYPGDAVKLVAAGTVSKFANGDGKVLGIAAEYATSASTEVWVYDDPGFRYEVQADTAAAADIGLNADISGTDTADTDLRTSGNELLNATFAVTATLPFKILEISDNPDNDEAGANVDLIVGLNNCVLGGGNGSTGI